MEFHLQVKPCVDRILLFTDDLIGEMSITYGDSDGSYFNGVIPEDVNIQETPITAVLLCYVLGEAEIPAKQVFSRPFQLRPPDTNSDVMGNAICVNYFDPTDVEEITDTADELATAKFCIVDIPERLQTGLGLPAVIILQPGEFTIDRSNTDVLEKIRKHGIDPDAKGNFVKKIEHLWPVSEKSAAEMADDNIKISLYAHSIMSKLETV